MDLFQYPTPESYRTVFGYTGSKKSKKYSRVIALWLAKHHSLNKLLVKYSQELEKLTKKYPTLGVPDAIPGIKKLHSLNDLLELGLYDFTNSNPRTVGFIGEFSSGKSTLLNAILGRKILPTDVLQGTTLFPMELSYGRYGGEMVYDDGSVLPVDANIDPDGDIIRAVNKMAQVRPLQEGISHFRITLPNRKLLNTRLLDTPGINSTSSEHTERAVHAMKSLCDSFIVIIPSTQPLTQQLLAFLREHVSDRLHRCQFVITKFDLIRQESEQRRLIENIKTRLIAALELENTPDIVYTSGDVVLSYKLGVSPRAIAPF
jgi:ribosome biogenesis GTPase A